MELQTVCGYVDGWANKRLAGAFTPIQAAAMKSIHDLTFKPDDLRAQPKFDQVCAAVGVQVLVATGMTLPGGRLPIMRPPATQPARVASAPAQDEPLSVSELTVAIRQLSVSVPLRRELLALADGAKLENDPNGQLAMMLTDTVDLARGLQSNTAVEADTRAQIEQKLADGLGALHRSRRTQGSRLASHGSIRSINIASF